MLISQGDKSAHAAEYKFKKLTYYHLVRGRERVKGDLSSQWNYPEGHQGYVANYADAWMEASDNPAQSGVLPNGFSVEAWNNQIEREKISIRQVTVENVIRSFNRFNVSLKKPSSTGHGKGVKDVGYWRRDGSLLNNSLMLPDEAYLVFAEIAVQSFSGTSRKRQLLFGDTDSDTSEPIGMFAIAPANVKIIKYESRDAVEDKSGDA